MGSWAELDAIYPPGKLTPAAALIVALGHLEGARSVYADPAVGVLAVFLPFYGIDYDKDMLLRADKYLRVGSVEEFLAEASVILNPQQKRCLLINLLDRVLAGGSRPKDNAYLTQTMEALGMTAEDLQPYKQTLIFKNDLSVFPQ